MADVRKLDTGRKTGALSPLQSDILKALWKENSLTVRQIYTKIRGKKLVALTSIAVDLDRLHTKGVVSRKVETGLGGSHYIYSANKNQQEFEKSIVETTVDRLIEKFGEVAVDYFQSRFSNGGKK